MEEGSNLLSQNKFIKVTVSSHKHVEISFELKLLEKNSVTIFVLCTFTKQILLILNENSIIKLN